MIISYNIVRLLDKKFAQTSYFCIASVEETFTHMVKVAAGSM